MQSKRSRRLSVGLASFFTLMMMAGSAHAHGGMASADDLGPPLFTSAALAFGCYWLVILWPKAKRNNADGTPTESTARSRKRQPATRRTRTKMTTKQNSQLMKLVSRQSINFESGRTAGDV